MNSYHNYNMLTKPLVKIYIVRNCLQFSPCLYSIKFLCELICRFIIYIEIEIINDKWRLNNSSSYSFSYIRFSNCLQYKRQT